MLSLIRANITFRDGYYGFRSIGTEEERIKFPVIFVQPKSQQAVMIGTAKWDIRITYALYWYVRDNKAQDVTTQATDIGEALIKLFSNNAQSAASPTNQYIQYANPGGGYYWLLAEIKGVDWTVPYLNPQPQPSQKYECSGRMMIEIMDRILK